MTIYDDILRIAQRHSAYADSTPVIRGEADILAFATDVIYAAKMNTAKGNTTIDPCDEYMGFPMEAVPQPASSRPQKADEPNVYEINRREMIDAALAHKDKHGALATKAIIQRVCGHLYKLMEVPPQYYKALTWEFSNCSLPAADSPTPFRYEDAYGNERWSDDNRRVY